MDYYTLIEGETTASGPFTAAELLRQHESGSLPETTLAAAAGDSYWQPLPSIISVARADYDESLTAPAVLDTEKIIFDAMETGPPTTPLLLRLLKEDGHAYPVPRKKHPR